MQEMQLQLIDLGITCYCGQSLPILIRDHDNPGPALYRCYNCKTILKVSLEVKEEEEEEEG